MSLADVVLARPQSAMALQRATVLRTLRAAKGRPVERKALLALWPTAFAHGWLDKVLAALIQDGQVIRNARGQYAAVMRNQKGQS